MKLWQFGDCTELNNRRYLHLKESKAYKSSFAEQIPISRRKLNANRKLE
jgi:hypothetical protein